MDQDLQARDGMPEKAMQLGRMIAAQDGVFIAAPEYNASIPPLLKNAIDWVSRIRSDGGRPFDPWRGKIVALGSASNGSSAVRGPLSPARRADGGRRRGRFPSSAW